jgi:hypothetical protein
MAPRAIAEVKQRWSVIGWLIKNLLSRAPPCFRTHVKLLVPAAFGVVSTRQFTLLIIKNTSVRVKTRNLSNQQQQRLDHYPVSSQAM